MVYLISLKFKYIGSDILVYSTVCTNVEVQALVQLRYPFILRHIHNTPQDTPQQLRFPGHLRTPQDTPGNPRKPHDTSAHPGHPRKPQETPGHLRTPQDNIWLSYSNSFKILLFPLPFRSTNVQFFNLKRQCHEIFDLYFFSWIEPIWAPDKQAKMVFLKN